MPLTSATARLASAMPYSDLRPLAQTLAAHQPARLGPQPGVAQASVALLMRPTPEFFDVLLIQRAVRAGDPWSGQMALPGGRRDPEDASALDTAIRETEEEVGINLARTGTLIGELDDVAPRAGTRPIVVSPFVFVVPEGTVACTTPEVYATHWISVLRLANREVRTQYLHYLDTGAHMRFPAFSHEGQIIWGLTHRILVQFLALALPERSGGAR